MAGSRAVSNCRQALYFGIGIRSQSNSLSNFRCGGQHPKWLGCEGTFLLIRGKSVAVRTEAEFAAVEVAHELASVQLNGELLGPF